MPYRAPTAEFEFLLAHVTGFDRVAATDRHAEATPDTVRALLHEAGRICEEVLAPLNRAGDRHPARLENGVVRTSPGFAEGYRAMAEAGMMAIAADPAHGGLGLPITLATCVNEMAGAACLALQMNPLMTQGQIEALEHHASEEIKALYLPRLTSGDWSCTMNLTEPQAGSDVGALTTRAEPAGDGTYRVTGQKIYITWGDNDFTENVVHLVLARLPGAPAGTRGISLFLVPKRIPDAGGKPGVANGVKVVSLEHKLGLHGSPTCVMQYDDAAAWLVGEENRGMAAMFTMMNNARLGVAVHGVAIADAATQAAVAYATGRTQGAPLIADGTGTILDHADVRRMLLEMKAETFAARAMALDLAVSLDLGHTGDEGQAARAAVLTPIAKAYATEMGIKVANIGIQVHGGMGFIEETGVAQFARDVRVSAIYEGTNGIQAMDLVGRKMADGGAAIHALIDAVEAEATGDLGAPVAAMAKALRTATKAMLAMELNDRFGGAVPYLMGFARVLGALYHLRAARAGDAARAALARFYIDRLLPEAHGLFAQASHGAAGLYDLSPDDLAA